MDWMYDESDGAVTLAEMVSMLALFGMLLCAASAAGLCAAVRRKLPRRA